MLQRKSALCGAIQSSLKHAILIPLVITFSCGQQSAPKSVNVNNGTPRATESSAPRKVVMFERELSPEVAALAQEVEKLYGRGIHSEFKYDWEEGRWAYSDVDEKGVPEVFLNNKLGFDEEWIAHELLHLRLNARGYGSIYFVSNDPSINVPRWEELFGGTVRNQINDGIHHYIFRPDMERMGFGRSKRYSSSLITDIESGSMDHYEKIYLALSYYRAVLEVGDQGQMDRITGLYMTKGWDNALRDGMRLVELVRGAHLETPEGEMSAFLSVLNATSPGLTQGRIIDWKTQQLGAFGKRWAIIELYRIKNP